MVGENIEAYGLTKKELLVLRLMNALDPKIDKDNKLVAAIGEEGQKFLNKFITDAIDNSQLKSKLRKISTNPQLLNEIDANERYDIVSSIVYLDRFLFKARRSNMYLDGVADKFLNSVDNNGLAKKTNNEDSKITLGEYGIISDIHGLRPPLPKNIYERDNKLRNLFAKEKQIRPILSKLNKQFQTQLTGGKSMIAIASNTKRDKIKGVEVKWWKKILRYFTKTRTRKILFSSKNNKSLAHSYISDFRHETQEKHTYKKFGFGDFMYCVLYKLNVNALINKSFQDTINNSKKWTPERIAQRYAEIEKRMHDEILSNPKVYRIKFSEDNVKENRYKPSTIGDYKKAHARITGDFYKNISYKDDSFDKRNLSWNEITYEMYSANMTCSEFVARCTFAALVELDQEIKDDLNIKDDKKNIIKIPISKNQNLDNMTAKKFLMILEKHNCVEKVEFQHKSFDLR
ncbi:MAG: hypothetical protein HRT87_08205 [Legionellales bacterium]|nr:hypothetical protein [Legionellales bacterium]